jgi:hypothetical protein
MICPLCEKDVDKFHPNSHILPKWMSKQSKDPETDTMLSFSLGGNSVDKVQDSIKESIVCYSCEESFNKSETYVSHVLLSQNQGIRNKHGIHQSDKTADGSTYTEWAGLDFISIKKFVISAILKQYLSDIKRKSGKQTIVNDSYFKLLRKEYFETTDDDEAYPILMFFIDQTIAMQPTYARDGSHRKVQFMGANAVFTTWISNHRKDDNVMFCRLKKNGSGISLHMSANQFQTINELIHNSSMNELVKSKIKGWYPK